MGNVLYSELLKIATNRYSYIFQRINDDSNRRTLLLHLLRGKSHFTEAITEEDVSFISKTLQLCHKFLQFRHCPVVLSVTYSMQMCLVFTCHFLHSPKYIMDLDSANEATVIVLPNSLI